MARQPAPPGGPYQVDVEEFRNLLEDIFYIHGRIVQLVQRNGPFENRIAMDQEVRALESILDRMVREPTILDYGPVTVVVVISRNVLGRIQPNGVPAILGGRRPL